MTAPTKTPIDPSEIRAGDLIRWEWADDREVRSERAIEYVSARDGGSYSPVPGAGHHYLLDRPTPPVELPNLPALGFVRTHLTGTTVAFVGRRASRGGYADNWVDYLNGAWNDSEYVTAFTPATAVPTDALDRMRRVAATCDATYPDYKEAVFAFLAAVDEATS